ncbi:DUF1016 domain-containing protein [Paludibacter sp. 221]|uniref:PDDEXK nuclease domain-containing protein n=1 Tax=Paludibacter sp. 221 TaxID=2302939 RepID=UPI0013D31629|nr:PDDEXK nuclease domain-containing protein [Paludibacter sp. 221]NDV45782.1 DUF1016 domain-containing protein [Paludibacter sp. 221]
MSDITLNNSELLQSIINLIDTSRRKVALNINSELTLLYWHIGKEINNNILKNERADYGKTIVKELSKNLTKLYGNGFTKQNVYNFVKLNETFSDYEIVHSVSRQLTWTHLRSLIYIEDDLKREFYIRMAIHERWSVRIMQERINNMLYERTAISKKPEETINRDLQLLKAENKLTPDLVFRDPYFLDFLGLYNSFSEKDLESTILNNLQQFLIELGSDFAFIARQKRIVIDNEDFRIDLLFYHRSLCCLIAIELKLGKFKASYKGQMELYLRWLERNEQRAGENKPIGLILCSEKSPEQINYLMLDNDEHIKVAEYITLLPTKDVLEEKLRKAIYLAQNSSDSK